MLDVPHQIVVGKTQIIVAGERITPDVIAFLEETHQRGGTLKGASGPNFETIQIIA